MNKEINQLINQLHLDPKREAAVRKLVENAGGNKEVSGGGGPVIIEYPLEGTETVTLTDEQIEAVKNSNVKFKLTVPDNSAYVVVLPAYYEVTDNQIDVSIYLPSGGGLHIKTYAVNINNKTITKYQS